MKTYSFVRTGPFGGQVSLSEFRRSQQAMYGLGKVYLELLGENEWSNNFFCHIDYVSVSKEYLVVTGSYLPKEGLRIPSQEVKSVEDVRSCIMDAMLLDINKDKELVPRYNFELKRGTPDGDVFIVKGAGLPSGGLIVKWKNVSTPTEMKKTLAACVVKMEPFYGPPEPSAS